ncbi:ABC transporter permease subunit [Actinomadura sp. HBU206391]|nr:ABC transporter permease subunit [Actinomadura sp. HBU206391]
MTSPSSCNRPSWARPLRDPRCSRRRRSWSATPVSSAGRVVSARPHRWEPAVGLAETAPREGWSRHGSFRRRVPAGVPQAGAAAQRHLLRDAAAVPHPVRRVPDLAAGQLAVPRLHRVRRGQSPRVQRPGQLPAPALRGRPVPAGPRQEAARIDGATTWQQFRHITLPMLRPVTTYVVITSLIGAFQIFEAVYLVFRTNANTIGGVLDSGLMIVPYLYDQGFTHFQLGYASAIAWVLFVIIFAVSLVNLRLGRATKEL